MAELLSLYKGPKVPVVTYSRGKRGIEYAMIYEAIFGKNGEDNGSTE